MKFQANKQFVNVEFVCPGVKGKYRNLSVPKFRFFCCKKLLEKGGIFLEYGEYGKEGIKV